MLIYQNYIVYTSIYTECIYNDTLSKEAANAVAEVYADQCRSIGAENSEWRSLYSAGKIQPATKLLSTYSQTQNTPFSKSWIWLMS